MARDQPSADHRIERLARRCAVVAGALMLALAAPAVAQSIGIPPASAPSAPERTPSLSRPVGDPGAWSPDVAARWDAATLDHLAAEDEVMDRIPGEPRRVAVSRSSPLGRALNPAQDGWWDLSPAGGDVWRMKIEAPGALGLRVEFTHFDLPAGARVVVSGSDPASLAHDYTGAGPNGTGTFLSHSVGGDAAYIEYVAPPGVNEAPMIEIGEILHIYRSAPDPRNQRDDQGDDAAPCQVDASCQNVDRIMRDSVGRMFWRSGGFGYVCTGALLNDADPSTFTGWFLTANHCVDTQAKAQTVEVFWFYTTSGCNGSPAALFSLPRSVGADFISGSRQTDFSLLRLREEPRAGQTFAGWTTSNASGSVTTLHHPGGSYRRITRGTITPRPIPSACLGLENYLYVRVTQGLTEGGSSGAPLFNDRGQIVGQLYGGCGAPTCRNGTNPSDIYGRFSVSYQLGQLQQYLDAAPTDDPYEPNNTPWTAKGIQTGITSLLLNDDNDYFFIDVPISGRLIVRADFDSSKVNLDLQMMTPSGLQLGSSMGFGNSELVSRLLTPGRYLIRAYRAGGGGGPYTLTVNIQPGDGGDVDGDGLITPADVAGLLRLWGRSCADVPEGECPDFDGSGVVDAADLDLVLRLMGYSRDQVKNGKWKKSMKQLQKDDSFRQRSAPVVKSAQKQWKKILNNARP